MYYREDNLDIEYRFGAILPKTIIPKERRIVSFEELELDRVKKGIGEGRVNMTAINGFMENSVCIEAKVTAKVIGIGTIDRTYNGGSIHIQVAKGVTINDIRFSANHIARADSKQNDKGMMVIWIEGEEKEDDDDGDIKSGSGSGKPLRTMSYVG